MNAYDFGQLINRFYQVTTNIIHEHGGMVEKLGGDEVTAFFIPAFTENHNFSRAAVKAGQVILAATGHEEAARPGRTAAPRDRHRMCFTQGQFNLLVTCFVQGHCTRTLRRPQLAADD
jgi:hypothetical protein